MSASVDLYPGWNCPIHGGFGYLNRCAWPDCPHGVDESSIEVPNMLKDRPAQTYHRVSWHDPSGDEFYNWQKEEMPNWFSLSQPYSYFAKKIECNSPIEQMFHYTSPDGALAIIQSGCMRFTDYAYLNDMREITHGLDIIRATLEKEQPAAASQVLMELKAYLENGNPLSPYNIYTTSFSSDPDSLSQFRLYGPVALGFDPNPNSFGYFKGDINIGHVVYDPKKQARLIELFFAIVKQIMEKDVELIDYDNKKEILIESLIGHLLRISALFKHPAFSDEREVRLMYSEPLEIMEKFGQEIAQRQFRISGGLIVPFTNTFDMIQRFPSDERGQISRKLPLKSVVIGPMAQAEALANGMRDLLRAQGYCDVEVSLSEAPFRP